MTFGPKQAGRCLACQVDVHEFKQVHPDGHPRAGAPARLGPQLDHGTQLTLQMSNGAEADIAFCIECANQVRPAHLQEIWSACIDATEVSLRALGRSENQITHAVARQMRLWPVAILWKRRHAMVPGGVMIDRR